jgi:amino acid transporter
MATGAIAAVAMTGANYLAELLALGPDAGRPIAIGLIVVLTVLNVLGVRIGATTGNVLTVHKMAAIAFLVLAALSAAALPGTSLLRLWWGLTLLGILIEVIQGLPGVNRGPSVLEAIWDSAVVAAVFLVVSIGAVRRQAGGPHSGSDHR